MQVCFKFELSFSRRNIGSSQTPGKEINTSTPTNIPSTLMNEPSSHFPNIPLATPRDPGSLHVGIIGAGLSGLMCAQALRRAGISARVFDKGRAPGGRCSTRRASTAAGVVEIVHGLPYINTSNPPLSDWLRDLEDAELLRAHSSSWVGAPTFTPLIEQLCAELSIDSSTRVEHNSRQGASLTFSDEHNNTLGAFTHVVCTAPAPHTATLLADLAPTISSLASDIVTHPVWTLLLVSPSLPHTARASIEDISSDESPISKVIITSAPSGQKQIGLSVQASTSWSRDQLEATPESIQQQLLGALEAHIGQRLNPTYARAHRWRYALATPAPQRPRVLADHERRVYACGDWLANGRADGALLSGIDAANAIISSTD